MSSFSLIILIRYFRYLPSFYDTRIINDFTNFVRIGLSETERGIA